MLQIFLMLYRIMSFMINLLHINFFEISVRPTSVEFTYDGSAMSVNQEYQLTCLAFGSHPVAIITWWIGDRMISTKNYKTEVNCKLFINVKLNTTGIQVADLHSFNVFAGIQ